MQADREPRRRRERAPQAVEAVGGDVAEPERAGADERVEPVLADELADLRQVVGVADEVLRVQPRPVAPRGVAGLRDAVGRDDRGHPAGAQLLAGHAVARAEVEHGEIAPAPARRRRRRRRAARRGPSPTRSAAGAGRPPRRVPAPRRRARTRAGETRPSCRRRGARAATPPSGRVRAAARLRSPWRSRASLGDGAVPRGYSGGAVRTYDLIADLPVRIDEYSLKVLERHVSSDFARRTTVVHLRGNGEAGHGQDVAGDWVDQQRALGRPAPAAGRRLDAALVRRAPRAARAVPLRPARGGRAALSPLGLRVRRAGPRPARGGRRAAHDATADGSRQATDSSPARRRSSRRRSAPSWASASARR